MKEATLCFLINEKENKILLGLKKRGFGQGKFNGFGGKVENNENVEQAVIRELYEEANVNVELKNIQKLGELDFEFPIKKEWNQKVHVFFADKWKNEPKETDEMKPVWFKFNEIPFEKMWDDDKHWMPLVLKNKKIKASFLFKEDNEKIKEFKIEEIK